MTGLADGTKTLKLKLKPAADSAYAFGALPKLKITILDIESAP